MSIAVCIYAGVIVATLISLVMFMCGKSEKNRAEMKCRKCLYFDETEGFNDYGNCLMNHALTAKGFTCNKFHWK